MEEMRAASGAPGLTGSTPGRKVDATVEALVAALVVQAVRAAEARRSGERREWIVVAKELVPPLGAAVLHLLVTKRAHLRAGSTLKRDLGR